MAEVKNSFLKSKMNKDLDARLLPNGEYRDALNVSISKSENANVGALENVEGNNLTVDVGETLNTLSGVDNLKIIGQHTDKKAKIIYLFLTNHSSDGVAYDNTAVNWICSFNLQSLELLVYSTGAFLNFSTRNTILSVNLLESILYWTDDRNQPRKINVQNSLNVNQYPSFKPFYTNEDQISVAKIAPHTVIDLYKENNGINETTLIDATSIALPEQYQATVFSAVSNSTTINITDYSGTDLENIDGYYVWSSDGQLLSNEGVLVTEVNSSQIVISKAVTFSASSSFPTLFFAKANPKYNELYPGDATFLEDKFVRFSYRFKFIDGEYSIMAPFTQICFIPKQYGFFLQDDETSTYESSVVDFMQNQVNQVLLQLKLPGASNELLSKFLIEEIDILYKESTGTSVSVADTITANQLTSNGSSSLYQYDYQSTEPFKTLPELQTTRVYDKVPVKAFGQEIISNRIVYANYQNKHTPPSSLDYNVGVSTKFSSSSAQSNKSNVSYPNHTLKQNRTYQVGVILADRYGRQSTVILSSNQNDIDQVGNTDFGGDTFYSPYRSDSNSETSVLQWAGDSIKVLFNSVIQSNKQLATSSGGGQPGLYNGDSTSVKYNPTGWYSYKVVVKQTEQEYYNVYLPSILNGVPAEATTFLSTVSGTMATLTLFSDNINKVPRDLSEVGPDQRQFRSSVRMWGRVSPQILAINASFPTNEPAYNQQYYPDLIADTVTSISVQKDMFNDLATTAFPLLDIYESESNPILARVSTRRNIGSVGENSANYPFFLSVYETEPTKSRIDIYWETSTSGLISELNNLIETSIPGTPNDFSLLGWKLNENIESSTDPYITDAFWPTDIFQDAIVNSQIGLFEVRGGGGALPLADSRFELETIAIGDADPVTGLSYPQVAYRIKINSNFVFLESSTNASFEGIDDYLITFEVSNVDPSLSSPLVNTLTEDESLQNTAPYFGDASNPPPVEAYTFPYNSFVVFASPNDYFQGFEPAQNGSTLIGSQEEGLRWQMSVKQFGQEVTGDLEINETNGRVTIPPGGIASGEYDLTVNLIDASGFGLSTSINVNFVFGLQPVNCQFNQEGGLVDFSNPLVVSNIGNGVNDTVGGNAGLIFWSSTSIGVPNSQPVPSWNSLFPNGYAPTVAPISPYIPGVIFTEESTSGNFNTKSINLGNGPSWCDSGNAGLTKGTGYIIVTLQIDNASGSSLNINQNFVYATSNIILQRRDANNTSQWLQVEDIENQFIDFQDDWRVDYYNTSSTNIGGDLQLGSLTNGESSPNRIYGTAETPPPGQTAPFVMLCASKAFAIRKQGDLRLCINNLLTDMPNPTPTNQVRISVTYGDFYYPNQQNDIAYSYRVYNNGQLSEIIAKNVPVLGWATVYAREPLLKYVSAFYMDSSLQTPWVPSMGDGDWFVYVPGINAAPNTNLPIQVNNAFPDNSAIKGSGPSGDDDQYNRRYVARFDSSGEKIDQSEPRRIGN